MTLPWPWMAMVAGAFVAFGVRVGHEPLWLDETYSAAMVEHGFADVVRLTSGDVHPPLYYSVLKLSTLLVGTSPAALRMLSVLGATGLVALGAGPVRRLWDNRTGWVFALLTLSSSGILCFAQEARMYALAAFLVTAAALYGHLALRDGRRADFITFGAFTWAASSTHYFALVATGMNALVLLFAARRFAPQRLRPLAIATAVATVGFLPWAPFFWGQVVNVTKGFWIPPTSFDLVVFGLVAPFAYKFEDTPYPWQAVAALLVTVAAVGVSLCWKRLRASRSETFAQMGLLEVFALTLGFGLAFSFLVRPIFMPRYMIVCAGLFLAAVAAAIGRLPGRAGVALTALLVVLGLPAWMRIQMQTFNGPFAQLARQLESAGQPAPVLVHNGFPFSFALRPAAHAVPSARHLVIVPQGESFDPTGGGLYASDRVEAIDSLGAALNSAQRIWIIDGSPGPDSVDATLIDASPLWRKAGAPVTLTEPRSWVKLTVRRYERLDGAPDPTTGQ